MIVKLLRERMNKEGKGRKYLEKFFGGEEKQGRIRKKSYGEGKDLVCYRGEEKRI